MKQVFKFSIYDDANHIKSYTCYRVVEEDGSFFIDTFDKVAKIWRRANRTAFESSDSLIHSKLFLGLFFKEGKGTRYEQTKKKNLLPNRHAL